MKNSKNLLFDLKTKTTLTFSSSFYMDKDILSFVSCFDQVLLCKFLIVFFEKINVNIKRGVRGKKIEK